LSSSISVQQKWTGKSKRRQRATHSADETTRGREQSKLQRSLVLKGRGSATAMESVRPTMRTARLSRGA